MVLVISDAVENLSNSLFEKLSTFLKISDLIDLAAPALTFDAVRLTRIVAAAQHKVINIIYIPILRI